MDTRDTIAAPITAPGQAAVSCIRVSGQGVKKACEELIAQKDKLFGKPRTQVYTAIFDLTQEAKPTLDYALACFYPGPNSFTGEDVVEFQIHGSAFIQQRLLECLFRLGVSQARPGEFTKRAYLNGRMDLSQAEGVADIIAAETEAQARVAQQQLSGRLSGAINELGEPLRDLLAEIEAYIDFPEEDIAPLEQSKWINALEPILATAKKYVNSYRTGRVYRDGAKVVLAGVPNAGKSSLLNALVGEGRAIVTAIPGTTRDSIESRVDLNGLALSLWDTAGLVESGGERDEVERLGIERSWNLLAEADLVLFLFSPDTRESEQVRFFTQVAKRAAKLQVVVSKQDTVDEPRRHRLASELNELIGCRPLFISSQTGDGLDELRDTLYSSLVGSGDIQGSLLICNRRHFEALMRAVDALERVEALVSRQENIEPEFIALELRAALSSLQEIVGVTHTEDILGRIFSKFCIGK